MIQFSNRNEKMTKLFATTFWILVGFHIIFGCIPKLIQFAIYWLSEYKIFYSYDIVDIRYVTALNQWVVS